MEGTIGEIRGFAANFAPRGWALCEGQTLAISTNTALFSVIGTTYGGNGTSTFQLPDLRGRTMIGPGVGPGLSPRELGEKSGYETNTLNESQMPSHSHLAQLNTARAAANTANPSGASLAGTQIYENTTAPNTPMSTGSISIGNSGGNQPVNNMQPYLAVNYIICVNGLYPSRP